MVSCFDAERDLPVLSDQQVQSYLLEKIEKICKKVGKKFRLRQDRCTEYLFTITADDFSTISHSDRWKGKMGVKDADILQQIGLQIMQRYGFNEQNFKPDMSDGRDNCGVMNYEDGVSTEKMIYPSETVKGLAFERSKIFETNTGKPIHVSWSVAGNCPYLKFFRKSK